jgi:hypothetical protein
VFVGWLRENRIEDSLEFEFNRTFSRKNPECSIDVCRCLRQRPIVRRLCRSDVMVNPGIKGELCCFNVELECNIEKSQLNGFRPYCTARVELRCVC